MDSFKLTEVALNAWLNILIGHHHTYIPVAEVKGGFQKWLPARKGEFPVFLPGTPKSSIKQFFFPQPEPLSVFSCNHKEPDAFIPKAPVIKGDASSFRVLFGVRPCDARSVMLNALAFKDDPYYQTRLKENAIIGMGCLTQTKTCFCSWVGGSPLGREGMDILLVPLDSGDYVAEVITDRGRDLIQYLEDLKEASSKDLEEVAQKREKADGPMSKMPPLADQLKAKELLALYNAPFWDSVAEPCINCGACTFLCPTCYCFDIQDEVVGNRGRRIRYWDSCMFPLFTKHASGHNPRGDKTARVRNRFLHKFKYFPDRFGPVSCVGCGRCIKECPVNIDIREVVRDLLSVKQ